jgi:GTPase involved in cell partitioning and DNA repair
MRFREVREIKTIEKKKVIPSQYLINELIRYFDEIDRDTEDVVMSKLDMIKSTSPEQLDEMLHENLKGE